MFVLLYVSLLLLLMVGAVFFFVKSLTYVRPRSRSEIIAQLERQFHSSPSGDP
ncbi:MAG: hypothetical protein RMK91_10135 [Pseudanabaenaceae cyanobacterium SKYGB_i_bin29]|nr:hypothetical protein [Pseudanabaenaceae cyanobacterium SKYG29]MDW8422210.1 hypothetical protein [Pseudanabaenaceae cyanobacterium SKYGB_i_bin29]